jgi:hypothetical protein
VIALSTLLSPVELGWSQPSLFGFGRRFKNRVGHRSGCLAPGARSPHAGTAVAGIGHGRPVAAGRLARPEGAALHLGLVLAGPGWLRLGSRRSVHATRMGQTVVPREGLNRGRGCRGVVGMVFSPPLVLATTSSPWACAAAARLVKGPISMAMGCPALLVPASRHRRRSPGLPIHLARGLIVRFLTSASSLGGYLAAQPAPGLRRAVWLANLVLGSPPVTCAAKLVSWEVWLV